MFLLKDSNCAIKVHCHQHHWNEFSSLSDHVLHTIADATFTYVTLHTSELLYYFYLLDTYSGQNSWSNVLHQFHIHDHWLVDDKTLEQCYSINCQKYDIVYPLAFYFEYVYFPTQNLQFHLMIRYTGIRDRYRGF